MPIPKPNANESKEAFISRCMGNSIMIKEYPKQAQRSAICYSQFEKTKKAEMDKQYQKVVGKW